MITTITPESSRVVTTTVGGMVAAVGSADAVFVLAGGPGIACHCAAMANG